MSVINVKNIEKKFKVYFDKGQSLKEKLLFRNRSHYEDRWVLKDISFEVEKGEAVGLIGENGSGKSTLLKLLTKIMYPDKGSIAMEGRVSSLIELGAGFHPDMSGRENIYTNASIFGLNKKEIDKRIHDIIAFSELEEFIENPVRTYSSGMYMRLAFSVAINVDADVLLIDEILAVGDASFQSKCFNKLREIKAKGTTIVIVSHSLGQIEQICDRTIWINDGGIELEGAPRDIHPQYMNFMGAKRQVNMDEQKENKKDEAVHSDNLSETKNEVKMHNGKARITSAETLDGNNISKKVFKTGETVIINFYYTAEQEMDNVVAGIAFYRGDGVNCYGTTTLIDHLQGVKISDEGKFCFKIDKCYLLPSQYTIDVAFATDTGEQIDYRKNIAQIDFYSELEDIGIMRLNHEWNFDNNKQGFKEEKAEKLMKDNNLSNDLNINLNILRDGIYLKELKKELNNTISVWGDEERLQIAESARMVNTLFNTSSGKITVGEFTFTGHNVSIITGTHPIGKQGIERQELFPTEGNDIIIGNGVWICTNATILGPCEIGNNAVIAAGSVVLANTTIPPNTVFAGIPAKLIKEIKE